MVDVIERVWPSIWFPSDKKKKTVEEKEVEVRQKEA